MGVTLYYYTGTGNALWAARSLAQDLGAAAILPMAAVSAAEMPDGDALGLCFPVHIWGVPRRVVAFVEALPSHGDRYCFAVAVNAGQVAATLLQLEGMFRRKGMQLAAGLALTLPSNYIPWGGPGPEKDRQARIAAAREKLHRFSHLVAERRPGPVDKGPWWQNILFSRIYRWSYAKVPAMDKPFFAGETCTACGICRDVCPADNIALVNGRPQWRHACEQCMACIQWCPFHAIQYGRRTARFERYHHPEIRLQDLLHRPR